MMIADEGARVRNLFFEILESKSAKNRGVYSSLFQYDHTDKKLPFLAEFIKK